MATYEFLSDEWIVAANAARARHRVTELPFTLAMNLTVTATPFDPDAVAVSVAAIDGIVTIDLGHLDEWDVAVTLEYETAKAVLVHTDGEAAMAAFMAGKVRVEGDMTKLLAFQSRQMTDAERALADEIRALTAP